MREARAHRIKPTPPTPYAPITPKYAHSLLAKEGVIGMLTAVELAVRADEGARYATLLRRVERVTAGLRHVGWLDVTIVPNGRQGQPCPRAVLRLRPEAPLRRQELLARLQGGDPSIVLGPFEDDPDAVYVHPLGLSDDEADEVVVAVSAVGSAAPTGV